MDFVALRERLNTSSKSNATNTTSLHTYLSIYDKATTLSGKSECYLNYMEGARVLADWLAPIEFPPIEEVGTVPDILRTYELCQLAKILSRPDITTSFAEDAIYTALVKKEMLK